MPTAEETTWLRARGMLTCEAGPASAMAAPAPRTFPSRWPLFALDRIWISPRQRLLQVQVHRTALSRVASDHLPLVAHIDG